MFPKPKRKRKRHPRRHWREARAAHLTANPQCAVCDVRATEVHHKGGRLGERLVHPGNLLSVCGPCHARIHANPAWARARGLMVSRFE